MTQPVQNAPKWRKLAISSALSAVITVPVALALARAFRGGAFGVLGPSELIAAVLGLFYLLIGVQASAGVAVPRLGARMLNVEDADDLREQRLMMACSGAAAGLWGAMLIVLALAAPGGRLAPTAAFQAALILGAISAVLTLVAWRHMDELMRGLSNEAGNLSYHLLLVGGGGWAILAHLGLASAPAPLDWLTMLLGLVLLASLIAAGRRGLLQPR